MPREPKAPLTSEQFRQVALVEHRSTLMGAFGELSLVASREDMGILQDPRFQSILHAISVASGVEQFSLPE